MRLIGRWERVREFSPVSGAWGCPWLVDRKWSTVNPFKSEEWWQHPSGQWMFVPRGGVAPQYSYGPHGLYALNFFGGVSISTLALDSNYVAGTSGDAFCMRAAFPFGFTLSDVYFNISTYTGTAANVNDIDLELRPDTSGGNVDTATLTESKTKDPASSTGWIKVTGWTSAIAAGVTRMLVVGDADGNTTDYATVRQETGNALYPMSASYARLRRYSTTDGWVTQPHAVGNGPSPVIFVGSLGEVCGGSPFISAASSANNTLQKGLRIATGLDVDMPIFGLMWVGGNNAANLSGLNIWSGSSGPSGTADEVSTNVVNSGGSATGKYGVLTSSASFNLAKDTPWSIMVTFSANQIMTKGQIGTGVDANLKKAMPGRGDWYFREEVAGPAWSDTDAEIPQITLLLDDPLLGGGGIRLAGQGGLAA